MNWTEVCENPFLQNLPFKVELNEFGQPVLSPASNRHGRHQVAIGSKLTSLAKDGEVISECSVSTPLGVKVADVAWASREFIAAHGFDTPYPSAPGLCVEILSPSNSPGEIELKTGLYFTAGALEVWLCSDAGVMTFITTRGVAPASGLFPGFPAKV